MGTRPSRRSLVVLLLVLVACASGPGSQALDDEPLCDTGKITGDAMRGALILPRDELTDGSSPAPAPWLVLHITGDGCLRHDGVTLLERDAFTSARTHALLRRLRQDALAAGRATLERRAVVEGVFGDVD